MKRRVRVAGRWIGALAALVVVLGVAGVDYREAVGRLIGTQERAVEVAAGPVYGPQPEPDLGDWHPPLLAPEVYEPSGPPQADCDLDPVAFGC